MSKTIFEAYNDCKLTLQKAGIEDYVFEAKQIIKHITGYDNRGILMNYSDRLTDFQQNNLTAIEKQRVIHYPLQYIFGTWQFYGLEFKVGPGVLIPRADTETLAEKALSVLDGKDCPGVLDLCAGSGCVGITVAKKRPDSTVTLVEKYETAADFAEQNIILNGVKNASVIIGDIFDDCAAERKYDLIVSNPPYIKAEDMQKLQPEVEFEPAYALYGGEDGLMFYRAIAVNYKTALKKGGVLAFEAGARQSEQIAEIMCSAGYSGIGTEKDINGIERVVFGTADSV